MRKISWLVLLTALLACLFVSGAVIAQTRTVEAQTWDVIIDDIDTTANEFDVTELQTLDFTGSFTFGSRDISLSNLDSIQNIEVRVNGDRLEEECRENEGTFCVTNNIIERSIRYYFPEPVNNETVNVEISYTVVGALRIYPNGDQIQWQAIPQRHSYPIESATVTIEFPEGFAPRQGTDPIASEGAPGIFTVTDTTVTLQTTRSVFANEKFSVRIQYPHDPNARMASWQPASDAEVQYEERTKPLIQLVLGGLGILLLIGGPLAAYALWSSRGREVSVIVPAFISEPPAEIHPALAGLFIDGSVQTRHILSTLFDLARRGYLKIEETRYGGVPSFSFVKSDVTPAGDTLSYYEKHLFDAVFSDGNTRSLDSMKNKFYSELSSLRRMVNDEIAERKYINPNRKSLERTFSGFQRPLLFGGIALAFFGFTNLQDPQEGFVGDFALNILLFGVALLVTSFTLRFLAGKISPYTKQGVEARKKTEAFKKFLEDREKFRELGYTSQTFETYLPYAIAFGMDREWLQRFQTVQTVESPVWYVPVFVNPTPYVYTDTGSMNGSDSGAASDLSGLFGSSDEPGGSSPNISLDSMSSGMSSSLGALSLGLGGFLNNAASAMTSAPAPVITTPSYSSSSDSGSSWGGSSGSDSGGWSSGDSGGGWSGGGDSGGGDSGGGGSDFG